MDYLFGTADAKSLGSRAVALSNSYAERRAEALKKFETKLLEHLEVEILRAASQGKQRLSIRFDRIYTSDLLPCDELALDLEEEEEEQVCEALRKWAEAQQLGLRKSNSTEYKAYIWWGDE
jgi:hypothetical protein